ncbi:MAG: nitroreductase family protein [Acidobacteriales bacterium]|nr:nitroreductase family protein [Terriglobales bacterium]
MVSRKEKPLSQAIRDRRTTPHFSPAPVPEEDLQQVLDAGLHAPSGYNTQPWRFVVVRETKRKKKLKKAAMDQGRVAEAPVVIVACGDSADLGGEVLEEMLALAAEHGYGDQAQHERVRKNFPKFLAEVETAVWLNRQVAIALTHMMLMAEALGYDTAIMEGFHEDQVKALLDIPASAHVVALLCIGKLKGPDKPFGGRFHRRRTVFPEKWGEE